MAEIVHTDAKYEYKYHHTTVDDLGTEKDFDKNQVLTELLQNGWKPIRETNIVGTNKVIFVLSRKKCDKESSVCQP